MALIRVWSKQNEKVAEILQQQGRYTAKAHEVEARMDDHAHLVLECYKWLAAHSPSQAQRPADADYPIWLSMRQDATMKLTPHSVILELEIEEALLTKINIEKWSSILNYAYIPTDAADAQRHRDLLELYGTNDVKAFSTPFYPMIRQEIENSWERLFDEAVSLGNPNYYGNIWEVKAEWVKRIIR